MFIFLANLSLNVALQQRLSVVQATGQEIPAIVISCIRIINLYGNCNELFLVLARFYMTYSVQFSDVIVTR